jgi:hypothetical protein
VLTGDEIAGASVTNAYEAVVACLLGMVPSTVHALLSAGPRPAPRRPPNLPLRCSTGSRCSSVPPLVQFRDGGNSSYSDGMWPEPDAGSWPTR